jgi:nickel-dependent lactate racemase
MSGLPQSYVVKSSNQEHMIYLKKRGVMKKRFIAAVAIAAVGLSVSATSVASAHDGKAKGLDRVSSILSSLVSNGTITQSQADAIVKAAESAAEAAKSVMKANRDSVDAVITSTLGISLDTLKTRLIAGESLATIAGAKKDALIAALIAEFNKQIDAALAAGKISATQATTRKAKTTEHVTNMVNKVKGFGKRGHGKGPNGAKASATSFKAA